MLDVGREETTEGTGGIVDSTGSSAERLSDQGGKIFVAHWFVLIPAAIHLNQRALLE